MKGLVMKLSKGQIIVWAIVLAAGLVSIWFYPRMPDKMASHWNAAGQVDGYISKGWGLLLMPLVLAGIALLFIFIPKIGPRKANIEKFRKYYDGFIILFSVFLLAIHYQIILWNLGIKISPNAIIPVGLGLLFFYIGILCENTKSNWFIGIRTPWTLSNETVWDKTHKIGGKLFRIVGIIIFAGILFQKYLLFFILIPTIATAVVTTVYSYLEFQKQSKLQKQQQG